MLALVGLLLQSGYSKESGFKAAGVYESQFAISEESLSFLQLIAGTEVFKNSVLGEVEVSAVTGEPKQLRISTRVIKETELDGSNRVALRLLSKSLRGHVVDEKNRALQYLGSGDEQALSDNGRRAVVKERIAQLERFLAGGELPEAVSLTLDSTSLESTEERLKLSADPNMKRA